MNDFLPIYSLVPLSGINANKLFLVTGNVYKVGKSNENDLVLEDSSVSRFHFEIIKDNKGYLIRDKNSTNGTYLNGGRIKEAYLRNGNIVEAGKAKLKIIAIYKKPDEDQIFLPINPDCSYRENKKMWNELFDKTYIKWLLESTQGNISEASRKAKMDRKYLYKLKKKYKI